MRIAIISEYFYSDFKGGVEKRYFELAQYLVKNGHEVHWFAGRYWNTPGMLKVDNVFYHGLRKVKNPYTRSGRRSIIRSLEYSIQWMVMIRHINAGKFDLIDVSQYPFFHCFIIRFLMNRKTKMVVTWYEFWGDHWFSYLGLPGFIGKSIEKAALRLSDGIIAVSRKAHQGIINNMKGNQPAVHIPNGLRIDFINQISPSTITSDIIYIGRLKNHKNVRILLETVSILLNEFPQLNALVAGDGPDAENLKNMASALNLGKHVTFIGQVCSDEEIMSLMKSSKVFMHPSSKEGGGSMTLIEANACGKPVIALKTEQGIDETLIQEGRNGFWVSNLNPELFAEKIRDLLQDNQCLLDMRESCISYAKQYSWDALINEYLDFYKTIVENQNA
jgi:glycosyltransferase involved in cell wall biosynthesis